MVVHVKGGQAERSEGRRGMGKVRGGGEVKIGVGKCEGEWAREGKQGIDVGMEVGGGGGGGEGGLRRCEAWKKGGWVRDRENG